MNDLVTSCFHVPIERIASWRQGPTVYKFGYVWAAKSLYYLWRDQGVIINENVYKYASIRYCIQLYIYIYISMYIYIYISYGIYLYIRYC